MPPASPHVSPLSVPKQLMQRIFEEARTAFPNECCGWLTGPAEAASVTGIRTCENAQHTGEHPTAADRSAETAYVIAGNDLLAFNRGFREPNPPRIIYHSHPNGRAYFSDTDQKVATSPWGDGPAYDVQQLVVGIDSERVVEVALFAWSDTASKFVEIDRMQADNVA